MKSIFQNDLRSNLDKMLTNFLFHNGGIMNWSILNKCILVLVLASLIHLSWIIWKVFVISSPELWHWVNLPLVKFQLFINFTFLCIFLLLIIPCYLWSKVKLIQNFMPYLAIGTFVFPLCRDGYLIGIFSPATMISYVSLITVGLVLFNRKIVYFCLVPATLYFIFCGYSSFFGSLPYAPLFNFYYTKTYSNGFWLLSMLYFIIPILITCLILFEILLSQWRYRESLIKTLSQIDPLTNIYNRRSINQCLDEFDQSDEPTHAVVLIDLDHFKNINDQFGHHKGDETLRAVSEVLSQQIREDDTVGRFGGEEFILVLNHSTLNQAYSIAERCRQAICKIELMSDHNETIRVTASFGIAIAKYGTKQQDLLTQADKALYQAKAQGRNTVRAFEHKNNDQEFNYEI